MDDAFLDERIALELGGSCYLFIYLIGRVGWLLCWQKEEKGLESCSFMPFFVHLAREK